MNIRTKLILILSMVLIITMHPAYVLAEEELEIPEITSGAALVMDMETGTVLFEKAAEERMYPASITKIVTAIVAIEQSELTEVVTVSEEARYEEGTRVYLSPGEQKTMELMLYGLLVNSGNDAATAIAEHIDGTKEKFSERMNNFVQEIGADQTHFTNPHGLFDEDHYTTALDMAKITRYAMSNSFFRTVVTTKTLSWHGEEWDSELVNHNKLLWRYEGATGVKNGYTSASGNTIVATAKRDGTELIVVLLQGISAEDIYEDATKLFDYGFQYLKLHPIEPEPETVVVNAAPFATDTAINMESATADAVSETKLGNFMKWPMTAAWLLMNLFLGTVGYLRWKRRSMK